MNNLKFFLLLTIWIGLMAWSQAQAQSRKVTLSGYLKDAQTGEGLIGATVFVKELGSGAVTNTYGFYSLSLPAGKYTVSFSYIGYVTQSKVINLQTKQALTLELTEEVAQTDEVVITAEKLDKNVQSMQMSVQKISAKQIKSIPTFGGESDIIKVLQMTPGIQSVGEGTTGLFVRGGSADQNLILLDQAPVYNASHLMGFFSVFNSDAIKDVEVYKGGMPARYGGRLSSVVDIKMNEGNSKQFSGSGGIGLISSRLTLEGPIAKDKASFVVSGRRTYADMFLRLSDDKAIKDNRLYFYDLNAKTNVKLGENDRLFLSGYFGQDVLSVGNNFGFSWGNATSTLRWNHVFNSRLFMSTTLLYSRFNYSLFVNEGVQNFEWTSQLQNVSGKFDFSYFVAPELQVDFGYHNIYHTFSPGKLEPKGASIFKKLEVPQKYALEQAGYISIDHQLTPALSLQYGLRFSAFSNMGKDRIFTYTQDAQGNSVATDTTHYGSGKLYNTYMGFEPRLGARLLLNARSSIKVSYNRTRQYIHLASNSSAGFPSDVWIPSDPNIKPQIADQVGIGYFRNFYDNMYEFSVEGYYKWMQNQIDFRDNANLLLNEAISQELRPGEGWASGVELMLRKNKGNTTGWVSYTLSKTERKAAGINNGNPYAPRHDRRHSFNLIVNHEFSSRLSLALNFTYATGASVTMPAGRYIIDNKTVPYYTERNGYRMPAYHRMDLSLTWKRPQKRLFGKKFQGEWNLSIYNAYARKNPFSIQFREDENTPGKTQAEMTYLFGIMPSVSYNFKF
ncbi:TonB-dependent receptor [uncultured Microscilla sp.]|uniref:TonB-dependent receptor n=1 Tax=uncultured Microscilla sp. TaxID=432653 RepID=UPI00261C8166|nr:TonB-dependent receptor [uncultured Microscilla sp.]